MTTPISKESLKRFFRFANLRERIRIDKESGKPAPWAKDPVLRDYRFCNVFREDDKTTVWFRENVRDRLNDDRILLTSTIAFRWFNLISTGEAILPCLKKSWDRKAVEKILRPLQKRGDKLFTGAYLIKSPPGVDKVTGLLNCIDFAVEHLEEILNGERSLQAFHARVMQVPYLGKFMAYEVVTDLRHTRLLDQAPDINTWASAGPGAARGLTWMVFGKLDGPWSFGYMSEGSQEMMLGCMQEILKASREPWAWDWPERPWEMREVEHTLCEYDKYRRGQAGQRLKRKFGGQQQ